MSLRTGNGDHSAPVLADTTEQDGRPSDKRWAKRRPSRTPAHISHTSLPGPIQVIVRDSSSTGALLELAQTVGKISAGTERLPQRFILTIPIERASVECDVAWRRGTTMGVRFVSPTRTLARPPSRRVQKSEPPSRMMKLLGFGGVKPL